jgi:hypothetical protein
LSAQYFPQSSLPTDTKKGNPNADNWLIYKFLQTKSKKYSTDGALPISAGKWILKWHALRHTYIQNIGKVDIATAAILWLQFISLPLLYNLKHKGNMCTAAKHA